MQKVLAGKSPQERAAELVKGTKLKDVALRKKLYEGGKKAIDASNDPMIALARAGRSAARAVRKIMETEVEEVSRQAYAQIAKAKFAVEGASTYPDATFTLRLAFGVVKGYEENGKHDPLRDDVRRPVRARQGAPEQAALRPAAALGRAQGQARPEDAVQLRLHGRHHRRQLGQPGHQPQRRGGRPDLRRQHPVAGARLRLHARSRPAPWRSTRRASSRRCARSTTPDALADELTGKK